MNHRNMKNPVDKLRPNQTRFLMALLTERTVGAAAERAGITERTGFVYLAEEGFRAAYRAARREAVAQAVSRLQAASAAAVDALLGVFDDPQASAPARIAAAKVILELSLRGIELEDITSRLEALENAAAEREPSLAQNGSAPWH